MAISLIQLSLLVILLSMTAHCAASSSESCFRLTAAVNYYGSELILIGGDEYISLNTSLVEDGRGTMKNGFGAPSGIIDAAFIFVDNADLYFFQGNNNFEYIHSSHSTGHAHVNSEWGPFFVGGIDAAATTQGVSFSFKGCWYLKSGVGEFPRKMEEIGFPCDVDAAWGLGDDLCVSRGDNVWTRDEEGNVRGPEKLSDLLTLTSTTFCREELNPYTKQTRDEQEYERDQNCVLIDAAITYYGEVYLFNDNQYIWLDVNGSEIAMSTNRDWGGLAPNIDAAIVWPEIDETYFFKGSTFFRYFYYYGMTFGPVGYEEFGDFYEQGVNAAGVHDGEAYVFKGCEIARYGRGQQEITEIIQVADLGFPCYVSAAFSRGNTLYVIKIDEIWTWGPGERKATGPAPLSTEVDLTSWTVCPTS